MEFIQYLQSDGIVLPIGCELPSHAAGRRCDSNSDEDGSDWDDDGCSGSMRPSFPQLVKTILDSIQELGGSVFPKLHYSSPKDAVWINCDNTLKCTVPAEVILLLKSSDVISDTITSLKDKGGEDSVFILCLRKWINVHPSGEFRCFIKDKRLIGVSQRQISNCYKHLLDSVESIMTDISCFIDDNHISNKFPLRNFVMDVYRPCKGSVVLLDFNPFDKLVTDPLLFSWDELNKAIPVLPELRLVDPSSGMQPSQSVASRLPKDAVDLATGEDIHKLVDLLKIQKKTEEDKED